MLTTQSASNSKKTKDLRIGLALAGGGPLGGVYELGALHALDEALDGIDLNHLHVYVGVSSGAILSAALANQLTTEQISRILIDGQAIDHLFAPDVFLKPAFYEYYQRAKSIPELFVNSVLRFLKNPGDLGLFESLSSLTRATPSGVYDNELIDIFLTKLFTLPGATNDFRKLANKLYVVAVDLDTAEATRFGSRDYDHVPISRAVQASAALPGLYPPVEIGGRYYVDGVLRKTLHASFALDEGADLVLCVNPLVPFDAKLAHAQGTSKHKTLNDGGLPVILAQTFRTLIHSRMDVGISKYRETYPHADLVLFEPNEGDSRMFFTNVFSYTNRSKVCELAYQTTRRDLLANREGLEKILDRHGIGLNIDNLEDPSRRFTGSMDPGQGPATEEHHPVTGRLREALDNLESWVQSN